MADIDIEVYREDVDNLSKAIAAVVDDQTGAMPYIDRAVIVAAALGNVACAVDGASGVYTAQCTTRLKWVASSWTWPTGG